MNKVIKKIFVYILVFFLAVNCPINTYATELGTATDATDESEASETTNISQTTESSEIATPMDVSSQTEAADVVNEPEEGDFVDEGDKVEASGSVNSNISWSLSDGTLRIYGNGYIYDNTKPWSSYIDQVEKVIIEEGVTNVGKYMFYRHQNLKEVYLPNSVTTIDVYAFWDCTSLKKISLGGTKDICNNAFDGSGLEEITITKNVAHISPTSFINCSNLKKFNVASENKTFRSMDGVLFNYSGTVLGIYPANRPDSSYRVPDSVETIETYAFYYSKNLSQIDLNKVKCIEEFAFYNSKLKSVTIPSSVETMEAHAFSCVGTLETVVFEDGLTYIPINAFAGCRALKNVTLSNTILEIDLNAFSNINNDAEITVPSNVKKVSNDAFDKDISVIYKGTLVEDYKPTATLTYTTHVQTFGWQNPVSDGQMSGTEGKAKRLEGIKIGYNSELGGQIKYSVHCQTYGWMDYEANYAMAGTSGEAKRLESITIELTGHIAKYYDVLYRVHRQTYGWTDWKKNGEACGTTGQGKRLEGIQIKLVPKGEPYATIKYRTHVQTYGWQDWCSSGEMSGTSGEAKRLEAIEICLDTNLGGGIEYFVHCQSYGDMNSVMDGMTAGTSGEGKRLENISIKLTGELDDHYDLYYRVHSQTYGWLDWAKGDSLYSGGAGTSGLSKRLEGIEIVLVEEGANPPGKTDKPCITVYDYLESKEPGFTPETKAIVDYAKQFIGTPYVYGGSDLYNGVDCSGYILKVYSKFGYYLPHNARLQADYGRKVAIKDLQPGDLLFYKIGNGDRIGHVGMYIGNGEFIHSTPGAGVIIGRMKSYFTPCDAIRMVK